MSPSTPRDTPANAPTATDGDKPRRFVPVPIETTSKTSRKHSSGKEGSTKIGRFTPEPIEATTESSRKDGKRKAGDEDEKKPAPRRFAPQPVETTRTSSKGGSQDKSSAGRQSRFKPQLVETSQSGNRKASRDTSGTPDNSSTGRAPRKFAPEVISTAQRSRRSKGTTAQDLKTEEGHHLHVRELQKHAGWRTPEERAEDDHAIPARVSELGSNAKRHVAPLDGSPGLRPAALTESRNHSFRCPDLDTIESSESERESGESSMSCSPGHGSPITASDSSFTDFYKHATRIRESVDENFTHYLLQLEAKKAQQRLQEQALAAFPNSDFHEPVAHYVNDDNDSFDEIEDRPVTWEGFDEEEYSIRARRQSTSNNKVPWEQLEMQRHAEKMEQERNANRLTAKEVHSPWWNPASDLSPQLPDDEMRSMRDRARPPMLGRDLLFPRCPSPEPARFDVTQGSDQLRQQMCKMSEAPVIKTEPAEHGLWKAVVKQPDQSMSSASFKVSIKSPDGKGLWGGFCVGQSKAEGAGGLAPPTHPTGLMTPAPEVGQSNPFEQSFASRVGLNSVPVLQTPPTPTHSINGADLGHLDGVLAKERDFEDTFSREYSDDFITQVFNYLSLGYPSLARAFDEELSKISRMPIAELRGDDVKAKQSPRGYIRLGPDFEDSASGPDGITTESCSRWQALKLYVREWVRQEKNMVDMDDSGWNTNVDATGGNWATTNRRGSWAF